MEAIEAAQNAGTGWGLLLFVLSYAVAPVAMLRVFLLFWPPDHPRRRELLAEYDVVPWWMRPLWVGDVAVRSFIDGGAARLARMRPMGRFTLLTEGVLAGSAVGLSMMNVYDLVAGAGVEIFSLVTVAAGFSAIAFGRAFDRSMRRRKHDAEYKR